METNQNKLTMTYTPNAIEHLGVRMYSTLPPVIAELVANAYDADASKVRICLNDIGDKEIIISDDGHGMSFSDINIKFLRIGRNRRLEEGLQESPGGRKVIGKKGLGKLSFFGVAHEIEVRTVKEGKRNSFLMKWKDIQSDNDGFRQQDYSPEILEKDVTCNKVDGTTIILREIQRSTSFDAERIADRLSKFFIIDADFNIFVKRNDEDEILIDNKRRYSTLDPEIEWNIPNDIEVALAYKNKAKITGHLMTTETPISPSTKMKGITLFSRKKLVNNPDYFSESTSSHFYTYLTGWLEVDFIDDIREDVIGTNRQSLNWEHPEMEELLEYLQAMMKSLEADWRAKRIAKRAANLDKNLNIKIRNWLKNVPEEIRQDLQPVIKVLIEDSEIKGEKHEKIIKRLQAIIKQHPYFHWQRLHPTLHELVLPYYIDGNYHTALNEGVKKYVDEVKRVVQPYLADEDLPEGNFLKQVFDKDKPKLCVVSGFRRLDGENFSEKTIENINKGQRYLSLAMLITFRHPLSHIVHNELRDSGLFTEQDCLDALGLLSHLFYRLDKAVLKSESDYKSSPQKTKKKKKKRSR